MSAAEVLEQFVFIDETGRSIGLMRRLNSNAQFGVIEINAVQLEETDQHVSEIGVFDLTGRVASRSVQLRREMFVVQITVIITTTIIIIGGNARGGGRRWIGGRR